MKTYTLTAKTFGQPVELLVAEIDGAAWYVVKGTTLANCTDAQLICEGVDIDELPDYDAFSQMDGIHTEEQLAELASDR